MKEVTDILSQPNGGIFESITYLLYTTGQIESKKIYDTMATSKESSDDIKRSLFSMPGMYLHLIFLDILRSSCSPASIHHPNQISIIFHNLSAYSSIVRSFMLIRLRNYSGKRERWQAFAIPPARAWEEWLTFLNSSSDTLASL